MTPNRRDYAVLAQSAYDNQPTDLANSRPVNVDGHQYSAIAYAANDLTGFHATAYQRVGSNEIIIAIRGTDIDLVNHTLTTLEDIGVDAAMVAAKINPQEPDARKFVEQMIVYAKDRGIPLDQITLAGHSLAGTLTEIEASRYGLHGETFNAYGAAGLGYAFPPDPRGLVNHVLVGDPVSAASPHLGQVVRYATPADIESLRAGGFLGGGMLQSPIIAARWSDHGIGNFAPAHGPGVMTAANVARAREYAAPVAGFRGGVQATHDHVHEAMQPNPLRSAPGRLQTGADLATAAAVYGDHAIGDGIQRATQAAMEAADAVERAARNAAKAVEHEAGVVEHAVESGARAARDTLERTAIGVQHTAVQAGEAIGRGVTNFSGSFTQGVDEAEQWLGTAAAKVEVALPGFSDPTHPQHAVYAALKARMPPDTSEDRLAQCTAACHSARLDKPEHLGEIYLTDTKALFLNNSLFGRMAEVDLTRAAPVAQQSLRQIEQFDRQQAEALQQQQVPQQNVGRTLHR